MAEFDPDAYLAGTDTGAFDPDAYLAEGTKESFMQKLGQFATPKIKKVAETLGKADTAIVRSPTFGPLYSAAKESAGTVLGPLISEEFAGKMAEKAGRTFPESRTAQIGAAALGTLGQILSPADLILPVVNKLRLLAKAPQAVKVAELANIQAKVEPKVFKAATEALSPEERIMFAVPPQGTGKLAALDIQQSGRQVAEKRIKELTQSISGKTAEVKKIEDELRTLSREHNAIKNKNVFASQAGTFGEAAKGGIQRKADEIGKTIIARQNARNNILADINKSNFEMAGLQGSLNRPLPELRKPFTLQAGLAEQNRAALEAFRAKLPQGPAIPPRIAQEAALGPKPAVAPTPPVITPKAPIAAVANIAEEAPPFKARLLEGLRGAEISRKKQELLNAMERSKRTAKLAGVKETGYQGYKAKMGALKGEFEKAEFESIKKNFTQNEVEQMFEHLNKTNKLAGEWERLNAQTALEKLIGAKGAGQIPTNSELSLLARVYGDDLVKELAAKQGTMEKLWTGTKDVLNLPRALMSTADLSMPLRQGLVLGAGNPKRYAQAFKEMFKYAWDEKAYVGLMDNIRKRPTYDLMRKNGLNLTELGKLGSKEEQFASNLAESIPVYGRVVRASNRAASGFLNKLRADVFDDLVKQAGELGALKDETVTKNIARFVNIGTGRGEVLDSLAGATEALNATFFSPKLMASRLQMLNPKTYAQLDPFTRKQALKSMRNLLGAGTTVLGIAKAAGADVGLDPRSADFGKIKIGDTRYDIWGGFQQYMVLASRLASGEMVSSTTGKEFTLGEGYKATTRLDIAQRFIESKSAPIASFIIGAMKGKTTVGDEFDVPAEVIDRVVPMMAQDYYDLQREYGPGKAAVMATPGVFGVGSQTYGKQVPTKTITKTGAEKIQFKNAPSIGSEAARIFRGEEKSNIPPEEQKSILKKRRDEALEQIEMSKIRAQVLETGEPQQRNGKLVYMERGTVRTKDMVPDKDLAVESLVSGVSAELRSIGVDFTPNYNQANFILQAVITHPQYKFATKDQRRFAINKFILTELQGNK